MKRLESRKVRSTGATVCLIDNRSGEYEAQDSKWALECETHGHSAPFTGRMVAEEHMSHPENWCEVCSGAVPEMDAPAIKARAEAQQAAVQEGLERSHEGIDPNHLGKAFARLHKEPKYENIVRRDIKKLKEEYPTATSITPFIGEVSKKLTYELWAKGLGGKKILSEDIA